MSGTAITLLVIAICLIPLAGVFGGLEAALQRVSKARLEELRREGNPRAARLEALLDDRARLVALLLLLRIVCETVAAVLVAVVLFDATHSMLRTVLLAGAIMVVVSYVLVGVGPRTGAPARSWCSWAASQRA